MTHIYYTVASLLGIRGDVNEIYTQLVAMGISAQLREQTVVCTQITHKQVIQVQIQCDDWNLSANLQSTMYTR